MELFLDASIIVNNNIMEKKSKFGVAADPLEEDKTKSAKGSFHQSRDGKKGFDALHVLISKPSDEIRKWQEIQATTNLPERRSYACSCVHNGRYVQLNASCLDFTFTVEST